MDLIYLTAVFSRGIDNSTVKLKFLNFFWQIGFLRRRSDGTTTLNILNPDNDGIGKMNFSHTFVIVFTSIYDKKWKRLDFGAFLKIWLRRR